MFRKTGVILTNILSNKAANSGKNVLRNVKNELTRSPKKDVLFKPHTSPTIKPESATNEVMTANRAFFKNFMAKNPSIENVLKNANFEAFGKNGLPLKYPREKFIQDLNEAIKDTPKAQRTVLFDKLNIEAKYDKNRNFISYEGFPNVKNLSTRDSLHQDISNIVNKFTAENEVTTKDPALNKSLNSLLNAFPEYVNVIGKKQHKNHDYSVDIHIMKVLKEAMNHPNYENLSDKDKTVMKLSVLFHDITKQEGVVDRAHPEMSALCVKDLIKRIKMPYEVKDRIFELVKNHHWLRDAQVSTSAENIATRFRNKGDYPIAKIMAASDLKGVNKNRFGEFGASLNPEVQAPIEQALNHIHNTGNVIMTSRIITPSRVPKMIYGSKEYKVLDFTKITNDTDLEALGFARGTKVQELRFLAHFLDQRNLLNGANTVVNIAKVEKSSVLSSSLVSLKNKKTYFDRKYGLVLNSSNSNLSSAINYDFNSGFKKSFDDFTKLLNEDKEQRTFLVKNVINGIEKKCGFRLSDDEYGQLYKQIMDKKHLGQLKDVKIGEKTIKSDDLKSILSKTQDKLFNPGRVGNYNWNEVIVHNPKIAALICKENAIKSVPKELLDFAHKNDLPIVLIGE